MRACKLLCGLAATLALLVGATACGGGDVTASQTAATSQETTATATTPPATTPPTTPEAAAEQAAESSWEQGATPAGLAEIGRRLEGAGYSPETRAGSDPEMVRVSMSSGGWAFVLARPKSTTAANLARSVRQLNEGSRGRAAGRIVGEVIYVASTGDMFLNGKEPLTDAQVAELDEIVGVGEGGG